ncbi:hypothetical protein [Undibacterium terreum]|uniref:SnoaL-like domain-containing protein n=1 Tax=Undibacterium terreum TaxID=1224302 RepID=A0A916UFG9_9BURK|nr:hypothetical protein [Undibacterium terreum]GGC70487.1 hypothetical protein GCM10011396_16970 [Undibacterium terreum]
MEAKEIELLVEKYIAVWNQPDAAQRREMIAQLWTEDGAHYTPSTEMHGYAELENRIGTAYQKWVRDAGYLFRYAGNAQSHHQGVRFNWQMVNAENKAISCGFDFLILDANGRILSDHQFLDPSPA